MDFLSIELANKVKKKGYVKKSNDKVAAYSEGMITLPHIYNVLKWLREEKKLHVAIELSDKNTYCWYIQMIDRRISKYSSHLNNYFDNWEKTALAAIEYALDNLTLYV